MFKILFSEQADLDLSALESDKSLQKRLKAVRETLGFFENNPRDPSLNTHKYSSLAGPDGEEIFEAYAENRSPAAYRVFWYYGPGKKQITIIAITEHP
jgi:hypothetical protein